jgi:hypothetical protein
VQDYTASSWKEWWGSQRPLRLLVPDFELKDWNECVILGLYYSLCWAGLIEIGSRACKLICSRVVTVHDLGCSWVTGNSEAIRWQFVGPGVFISVFRVAGILLPGLLGSVHLMVRYMGTWDQSISQVYSAIRDSYAGTQKVHPAYLRIIKSDSA